ncbi:TPA: 5'(3')-deoxyribonucleotidase [Staphylococcus aureus]|uniref:5' nucleotidase, NT5C type n=1 Tax=Staphylococcus aureus TaxID=1280 RepID=UPI000A9DE9D3|nr:5'(3')-deoxyribonucleotidase [Staphylococcus aureus]MBU7170127.1 5'(3')-deoxyribonucleotidase [Staphylococcus aureus]HCV5143081.1 5'(3')-deoxyribonucleotidase [Staphylococcus aureus]HCY6533954.1 5'(3')-deoxyribonucleotidase [Staphylococcus aureus]HCY8556391.1 5'(3')-deoxyribonucleotidase [Staphylococcus aureus]HCY9139474.1 5'(3')-deoxyribonucleotidase [Staphylococcus aureus]
MTRKSIAIDMDEVLADTLGEIIDAVNFRADLGIKMEALNGQKLKHVIPEHYDVYIATAAMDVPTSFSDKYEWLLEFFPFLDPQHFVFCGRKNIVKADYLIDDNPRQLEIFTGTPIMFTAVHNINDDRFERVNSWKDVEQYFLDNIEK